MAAHNADRLLGIFERHTVALLGNTVFQHHICGSLRIEPLCHVVPFVGRGLMAVTATRTHITLIRSPDPIFRYFSTPS